MKITKANYEAWLLDFMEGRLSEGEEATLRAFLDQHPELDAQLDLDDSDANLSPTEDTSELGYDFTELLAAGEAPPAIAERLCEWMDTGLPQELNEGMSDHERAQWAALSRLRLQSLQFPTTEWSELRVGEELTSPEEWLAAVAEGDVTGILADHARKDPRAAESLRRFEVLRLKADPGLRYPNKAALLQKSAAARTPVIALLVRFTAAAAMLAVVFSAGYYFLSERSGRSAQQGFTTLQLQERTGNGARLEARDKLFETLPTTNYTAEGVEPESAHSSQSSRGTEDREGRSTDRMRLLAKREVTLPREALQRSELIAIAVQTETDPLLADGNADNTPSPASGREADYMGLDTFLKVKTQEKLLKQEARPDEPLTWSLRDRALALVNDRIDGELALSKQESSKFRLRLGRFSVER